MAVHWPWPPWVWTLPSVDALHREAGAVWCIQSGHGSGTRTVSESEALAMQQWYTVMLQTILAFWTDLQILSCLWEHWQNPIVQIKIICPPFPIPLFCQCGCHANHGFYDDGEVFAVGAEQCDIAAPSFQVTHTWPMLQVIPANVCKLGGVSCRPNTRETTSGCSLNSYSPENWESTYAHICMNSNLRSMKLLGFSKFVYPDAFKSLNFVLNNIWITMYLSHNPHLYRHGYQPTWDPYGILDHIVSTPWLLSRHQTIPAKRQLLIVTGYQVPGDGAGSQRSTSVSHLSQQKICIVCSKYLNTLKKQPYHSIKWISLL